MILSVWDTFQKGHFLLFQQSLAIVFSFQYTQIVFGLLYSTRGLLHAWEALYLCANRTPFYSIEGEALYGPQKETGHMLHSLHFTRQETKIKEAKDPWPSEEGSQLGDNWNTAVWPASGSAPLLDSAFLVSAQLWWGWFSREAVLPKQISNTISYFISDNYLSKV